MIITVLELKETLNKARDKMLDEYIMGSSWTKDAVINTIYAFETGELKDDKDSQLMISHINYFFSNHNIYIAFYAPFMGALGIQEDNVKVFIPANVSGIVESFRNGNSGIF
jgi:hypothetical protein